MKRLTRWRAACLMVLAVNVAAARAEEAAKSAASDKPAKETTQKAKSPPPPRKLGPNAASVCPLLDPIARASGLPPLFFARLIWQESRFNDAAVSPKGAQGIAQFMPGTAELRGLEDPFEPKSALVASAAYLADLRKEFGNLGLAAAAYNAGPQRVRNWLAGKSRLPAETLNYVWIITGMPAGDWRDEVVTDKDLPHVGRPPKSACHKLAALLARAPGNTETAPKAPWGVQVAGGFSRSRTLAAFNRVKRRFSRVLGDKKPMLLRARIRSRGRRALYQARIGARSRAEAQRLCASLRAAGGACMVLRN